ncbi:MAG TPA: transcriptional regulator [Bacteroidetes bacterium]|nr:transcriptional regulator [Bacteroidota bacterium]HRK05903.1 metalloregulator ArsR/SmtB family transcription factor [Chlorobiota bacterium]
MSPTLFSALGHPTRFAICERLGKGPASLKELAEPFGLTLPSLLEHMRLLERSGLVTSTKHGRTRHYSIVPEPFERMSEWLDRQRSIWTKRLDQLDNVLHNLHNMEKDRS